MDYIWAGLGLDKIGLGLDIKIKVLIGVAGYAVTRLEWDSSGSE